MRQNKYLTEDDLYFSAVFGGGIYRWDGRCVPDPLDGGEAPLLTNIHTRETFYAKRTGGGSVAQRRSQEFILAPPRCGNILWPSDMVLFRERQGLASRLPAVRESGGAPPPPEGSQEIAALLFPRGGYPPMTSGVRKLSQISGPNWKNPEIQRMAVEIVKALEGLNRAGYVYEDIQLGRFFFREDNGVFLDFSHLVYTFRDLANGVGICAPDAYPVEFADPAFVQGVRRTLDFYSQNYSLCALLFYLFLGRYPYDGRLLTGYLDDSPQAHETKFRYYHKMPVFIFDPADRRNALGEFFEEQQIIGLWNELPEDWRKLFTASLCEQNAKKRMGPPHPPPVIWLRKFQDAGWI